MFDRLHYAYVGKGYFALVSFNLSALRCHRCSSNAGSYRKTSEFFGNFARRSKKKILQRKNDCDGKHDETSCDRYFKRIFS